MGVEDVIDTFIDGGGEGAYPSLQVTRIAAGALSGGLMTFGAKTYFRIRASIRPDSGSDEDAENGGRFTTESRILYTKSAELWTVQDEGPRGPAHDADRVTLYPIAADLELSSWCVHADGVIESAITGPDGNAVTLELVADGFGAGSLDESAWPAIVYHFENGVTTELDLETKIGLGTKLVVQTIGTPTALLETADANGTHALAGGAGELWRVIRGKRYRRFWKVWIDRLDKP